MDTNHFISYFTRSFGVLLVSLCAWSINARVADATDGAFAKSSGSSIAHQKTNNLESGDQDANAGSLAGALESQKRLLEINDRFPVLTRPDSPPKLYRVLNVDGDGILMLNDGRKLVVDGIECPKAGLEYLSRLLTFEGVSVAFIDQPESVTLPIPANLWLVEEEGASDKKDFSYMRIAETALLSGWCAPRPTTTSKYDARYAAIAELARSRSSKDK